MYDDRDVRDERSDYGVIVIGGGHAGAEAAWAAANMLHPHGLRVALVTMDASRIGAMSCNPAIGGLAKGQMVREIDALGGLMGLAADATGIQFRMLNASKGPAVRGPRCQSDKYAYAAEVQRLLATRPNLDIVEGSVERLVVEGGRCRGVLLNPRELDGPAVPSDGCCGEFGAIDTFGKARTLHAAAVVLTTGTFMRGLMHTGELKTPGGRVGEAAAVGISGELQRLGFELGRLKTGTPPRLDVRSLDLDSLEVQPGDEHPQPFSDMTPREPTDQNPWASPVFPALEQRACWITHTSAAVHDVIRDNLHRAPMYNGQIDTAGPRYCPSIEDKVVRFADRTSHHVFLEPESLSTNEIYCNGISTSLPADVQDVIVHSLPGCERAKILRYGYAVEYDMVPPHQIDATGETKVLPGLFLAGQINGTSGYEEAATQGLLAGLNAARLVLDQDPIRLGRDEAYLGVLMDDLVTKTPVEPYRMFTSRAEHRLHLRADNADERLTPRGRELGLVDDARWSAFGRRQTSRAAVREAIAGLRVEGKPMAAWAVGAGVLTGEVVERLRDAAPSLGEEALQPRVVEAVLAELLYAPLLAREREQYDRLRSQEHAPLPTGFDYAALPGLRTEATQTLARFRPATLGQATRLAGVTPADVMVVAMAVRSSHPANEPIQKV